jgi:3-oxoacyl-[acyl-carrier protein] reductase
MISITLENKVALVTGASRGIGKQIAISLATAGARVAVGYNSNHDMAGSVARECGNTSITVQGDIGNAQDCTRIIQAVIERYGRIDILINNAGILRRDSLTMAYDTWRAHWRHTLDTNFMSAVDLSYLTIPHMRRQGGGKIINIASRSAFRGETEFFAYAASKAAMVNFTRCLARTYAQENILTYAVAPGFIQTEMAQEEIERCGSEIRAQIPSGNVGTPVDVANVVLFLASDLSDYITGSTIDVNGGSYLH